MFTSRKGKRPAVLSLLRLELGTAPKCRDASASPSIRSGHTPQCSWKYAADCVLCCARIMTGCRSLRPIDTSARSSPDWMNIKTRYQTTSSRAAFIAVIVGVLSAIQADALVSIQAALPDVVNNPKWLCHESRWRSPTVAGDSPRPTLRSPAPSHRTLSPDNPPRPRSYSGLPS